jgi:hypothetical protein
MTKGYPTTSAAIPLRLKLQVRLNQADIIG